MSSARVTIESIYLDLRQVLRAASAHSTFFTACVLTFAIGIGVNVAVFSSLDRLLFRSLPFKEPERLTQIHLFASGLDDPMVAALTPYEITSVLRSQATSFDGLAFEGGWLDEVPTSSDDRALNLLPVSENALSVLGVMPILGHDFASWDADGVRGQTPVLLMDHAWRDRFGGADDVIGKSWRGRVGQYMVAGVLPSGFFFPSSRLVARVDGLVLVPNRMLSGGRLTVAPVARLRRGISLREAQTEIDLLAARHQWDTPALRRAAAEGSLKITIQPLRQGITMIVGPYLWLMSSAVWVVLCIACLNLSILMLVSGQARLQTMAIRTAIGASFGRLVRLSLVETSVLCLCGATLGWTTSLWLQGWLVTITPPTLRTYSVPVSDSRVLFMTLVVVCVSAVVTVLPLIPTLRRFDVLSVLRLDAHAVGARVIRGGRAVLLAIEASFSVLVTAAAIVAVPGFVHFAFRSPGFTPRDLFVLTVNHNWNAGPSTDSGRESERARAILDAVQDVAGVQSSTVAVPPFVGGKRPLGDFWLQRGVRGASYEVGAGYVRVLEGVLSAGREFGPGDGPSTPVAMLNEAGARILWPQQPASSVVGRYVRVDDVERQIVGVMGNVRSEPGVPPMPSLLLPYGTSSAQSDQTGLTVLVRMNRDVVPSSRDIADRLNRVFPRNGVYITSVVEQMDRLAARPRFLAVLFGSMALVAVLLTGVGVYAVASVECQQRRREIAIRVALGASRSRVYSYIGFRLVWPVALGSLCGVLLAQVALRQLGGGVHELLGSGITRYIAAASFVLVLTTLAAWLSARRVAEADPASELRST